MNELSVPEETIAVTGRNLGDYIRDAVLVGGFLAGVHAAGSLPGESEDSAQPVVLKNPSKDYTEAILADRMRAERTR